LISKSTDIAPALQELIERAIASIHTA